MAKGIDRIFEWPVIGLLLRVLFLERTHVILAWLCFLGGGLWLLNLWLQNGTVGTISTALIIGSLAVLGMTMLLALLFAGLEKVFPPAPRYGYSESGLREAIEAGIASGEMEISLRFNSNSAGFSPHATVLTIEVTGGQADDVESELIQVLREYTDQNINVEAGKTLWRRRVSFTEGSPG